MKTGRYKAVLSHNNCTKHASTMMIPFYLIDLFNTFYLIYLSNRFICLFIYAKIFVSIIYLYIYLFICLFIKLIVYLLIYLLIICIERRKHNNSIATEDKMTYSPNNGRDPYFNQEQKFKSLATVAKHFSKTTWNWKPILCLCITLNRKNEIFKYTNFGYSYNT